MIWCPTLVYEEILLIMNNKNLALLIFSFCTFLFDCVGLGLSVTGFLSQYTGLLSKHIYVVSISLQSFHASFSGQR